MAPADHLPSPQPSLQLPDRELASGISEIIKYGLIRDADLFAWLEANMGTLLARDPAATTYAIERSCVNKAEVVAQDEREGGVRATLNLGHTFGHAIETATGYGSWLHGEAVAAGMAMAADMSVRLGWIDESIRDRCAAPAAANCYACRVICGMPLRRLLPSTIEVGGCADGGPGTQLCRFAAPVPPLPQRSPALQSPHCLSFLTAATIEPRSYLCVCDQPAIPPPLRCRSSPGLLPILRRSCDTPVPL